MVNYNYGQTWISNSCI